MAKSSKVKTSSGEPPLPEKLVQWRTVSIDWRAELEKLPKAAAWRAQNLTPNCLFDSPLANADGSLSLFEATTPRGTKSLFYSLGQIKAARSTMVDYGVSKSWLKTSWNKEWECDQTHLTGLRRVVIPDRQTLKAMLVEVQSQRKASEEPSTTIKTGGNPSNPSPSSSARPVAPSTQQLSAIEGYKKRLASATSLPTPSPSVESSPEPSASESQPAPKKLRPTLTPAQEAAKLLKRQNTLRQWTSEFDLARKAWKRAKEEGGASFLSLDVEFWERQQSCLLEFGWSVTEFVKEQDGKVTERRDDQHVIVQENLRRRNGKFSPDARDHFDFGRSVTLRASSLYNLLHATFETLSSSGPLYLIFHDPRCDIAALQVLGFDIEVFQETLASIAVKGEGRVPKEGIIIADTQKLFSAWAGVPYQTGLSKCCEVLKVPTKRLHNAGNDARYTQVLFELMMDEKSERPAPEIVLPELS